MRTISDGSRFDLGIACEGELFGDLIAKNGFADQRIASFFLKRTVFTRDFNKKEIISPRHLFALFIFPIPSKGIFTRRTSCAGYRLENFFFDVIPLVVASVPGFNSGSHRGLLYQSASVRMAPVYLSSIHMAK